MIWKTGETSKSNVKHNENVRSRQKTLASQHYAMSKWYRCRESAAASRWDVEDQRRRRRQRFRGKKPGMKWSSTNHYEMNLQLILSIHNSFKNCSWCVFDGVAFNLPPQMQTTNTRTYTFSHILLVIFLYLFCFREIRSELESPVCMRAVYMHHWWLTRALCNADHCCSPHRQSGQPFHIFCSSPFFILGHCFEWSPILMPLKNKFFHSSGKRKQKFVVLCLLLLCLFVRS